MCSSKGDLNKDRMWLTIKWKSMVITKVAEPIVGAIQSEDSQDKTQLLDSLNHFLT